MKKAGLVESRKKGRWVYYRLPDNSKAPVLCRQALSWVHGAVSTDPAILKDLSDLNDVSRFNREDMCKTKNQA